MAEITNVGTGIGVLLFVYLAVAAIMLIAWVRILTKAGYSGWWILIAFVPLVNLVMFLVFAFSTWPIEQRGARYGSSPGAASPWTPSPGPSAGYPPLVSGYPPPAPGQYPPGTPGRYAPVPPGSTAAPSVPPPAPAPIPLPPFGADRD